MRRVLVATLALALCACHSSRKPAATHPLPPSVSTTTRSASSSSTTVGAQSSGIRTVLSPLGLNIRSQPSKSAAVRGTAAQATVLTVLAHTDQGGGWFDVKGSTLTGWISDNPTLTAPGRFGSYTSSQHQFGALYPEAWTSAELPPASVVFRPRSGSDTVVVTTASTVAQLGRGRTGYRQSADQRVVVCGITADLVTYDQAGTPSTATAGPGGVVAERLLSQVHLTLDAHHALGIDANLGDPSQLQTFREFVSSVAFPFPQCQR